jgi:lipid-binding SYLF domain-containing protein
MYEEPLILLVAFISSFFLFHSHRTSELKGDLSNRIEATSTMAADVKQQRGYKISESDLKRADCVGFIPGYQKDKAEPNVASGRGFLSCRNGEKWSGPAAIELRSTRADSRVPDGKTDVVLLLLDPIYKQDLASGQITIQHGVGTGWANGDSGEERDGCLGLYFARKQKGHAGMSFDGATLAFDVSANKALYGYPVSSSAIIDGTVKAPGAAAGFSDNVGKAFR